VKFLYFVPILLVISFLAITTHEGFSEEDFKNAKIVIKGLVLSYDEINDERYYELQVLNVEKSTSPIPEVIKVRSVPSEASAIGDERSVLGIDHVAKLYFFEPNTEREFWQASYISDVITRFCSNPEHVVVKMTRGDKPLICVTHNTAERLFERNILLDRFGFVEPLLEIPPLRHDVAPGLPQDQKPVDVAPELPQDQKPVDVAPELPQDQKPVDVAPELPQDQKQPDSLEIIKANNQFSLDFYRQVISEDKDNIFFSPLSISTAFAVTYEGTRGTTSQEIADVFGFPTEDSQRRSSFNYVLKSLTESESDYTLKIANAIWIAQGFKPLSSYVDTAKKYYDSKISNVDFTSEEGVDSINQWVREKTENKIEKLVEPGSTNELTRLILTNAIYFNGTWAKPFNKDATRDADFKINSDRTVLTPMMWLRGTTLNYTENEKLEVLEIPYEGEKISMIILLPKKVDGIDSLEKSLTVEDFSKWKESLSESRMDVYMPKFTFKTDYDLKGKLQKMGISSAFDQNKADFGGITDLEKLYIEFAIHKAFVDVNEVGTEAAGITGIGVSATSAPPVFKADHPFIFIIQEKETGNILFIGRMVDPTL